MKVIVVLSMWLLISERFLILILSSLVSHALVVHIAFTEVSWLILELLYSEGHYRLWLVFVKVFSSSSNGCVFRALDIILPSPSALTGIGLILKEYYNRHSCNLFSPNFPSKKAICALYAPNRISPKVCMIWFYFKLQDLFCHSYFTRSNASVPYEHPSRALLVQWVKETLLSSN